MVTAGISRARTAPGSRSRRGRAVIGFRRGSARRRGSANRSFASFSSASRARGPAGPRLSVAVWADRLGLRFAFRSSFAAAASASAPSSGPRVPPSPAPWDRPRCAESVAQMPLRCARKYSSWARVKPSGRLLRWEGDGHGAAGVYYRYADLAEIAYRVAYRVLGDRGDAEEVTQEALVRAYVRWSTVAGHDEPWVARVAMNLSLDRWRRRSRSTSVPDPPNVGTDPGPEPAGPPPTWPHPRAPGPPRRQREVIGLRYLADLSERQAPRHCAPASGPSSSTPTGPSPRLRPRAVARLTGGGRCH